MMTAWKARRWNRMDDKSDRSYFLLTDLWWEHHCFIWGKHRQKKEQRWWHFAARHIRVCEEGGRWTCGELTRLKSLDSVLWSLRRLTGDFALSARGDDEAYKEILCKHRWRSETWARSRGCCLYHRLLNKPLMYFTFVSLPGSHTHCFHNRSRCRAVVGKMLQMAQLLLLMHKKQTNKRTSDISCSTHWGIAIIF